MSQAGRSIDEDAPARITTVAFDRWLDGLRDDTRWELIAGEAVARTPPLIAHELIVDNVARALNGQLRERPCRVFRGAVGVQGADDDRRTWRPIPDLLVHCGPLDQRRRFVTDPLAIVEVLSPTTMDVDRGGKLDFYRTVPTLRHVVLLYQDQLRAEHYRRTEAGWPVEVLAAAADILRLEAIGCRLALGEAYADVEIG